MKTPKIKVILPVLLIVGSLSSCWAPRCPVDSCHVEFEHVHADYVSGIFSGRNPLYPPKMHYLWDVDKGESNPDIELKTVPGGRKARKLRKKFPWERW